jgi:polysaccharide biosynthesis/export protein ExoF
MFELQRFLSATTLAGALLISFAPGACAADYALGVGDKLRIKVQEWPDLSGEYAVGPAATISLPVIGDLPAGGVTTRELAQTISTRLRDSAKLTATPSSSVEIIHFRPFFILGDVQSPGEYAYRPGLTVLQAVTIAGGYYRPSETMFRLERDAIAAKGEIVIRSREARQLNARIARLEAEQKNAPAIAFPAGLDGATDGADQVLIQEERAIFAANNDTVAKTLETLDRYVKLYQQEIETIKAQIESEKRQFASVQKEFDSIKSLADKGLASLPRQLASERTLAQIQGTIQGLDATVLRARQNISQTEQRRIDLLSGRTERVNRDLQKARADAAETASRIRVARDLLREAEVIAPALYANNQPGVRAASFTIARPGAADASEIQADSATLLQPGDVLTVDRSSLLPARQQSSLDEDPRGASN